MGRKVLEDIEGSQYHGGLWICASFGSCWQNCRLSQWWETKSRHGLAPRRDPQTRFFSVRSPHVPAKSWTDKQRHLNAAHASHPGLAVDILRVHCNGMCTAQWFHMDEEEQKCRIACPDEPDSHVTTNALFSTISSSLPGGMLQSALEETTCFTTSALRSLQ